MKINRLFLIGAIILIIMSVGFASAAQDFNETADVQSQCDGEDSLGGIEIDIADELEFIIGDNDENSFDIECDADSEDDPDGYVTIKLDGKPATLKYDDNDNQYFILNDGKGGQVRVTEDNTATFCFDKVKPGSYSIYVEFKPYGGGATVTKTANIKVIAKGTVTDLGIDCDDVYVCGNHKNLINIIAPEASIGNLNIKVSNKSYALTKTSNTKGYINISGLDVGNYEIVVSDGKIEEKETFTVIHAIDCPKEMIYGSEEVISLKLPNATGKLIIEDEEGNIIFTQTLKDGSVSYSLSDLSVGDYEYTIYYEGSDYEIDGVDLEFKILPKITCPSVMTAGEDRFITFDFGYDIKGSVLIEADQEHYALLKLSGGKANVSLKNLDDGDVSLDIEFRGDDGFFFEKSYDIEVKSVKPKIIGLKNIKMTYGDQTAFKLRVFGTNAKAIEEGDGDFEIKIGKYDVDVVVGKNGVVTYKINVPPGKYKIKASYGGVSAESTLVVKHILKLKKVKVKKSAKKVVLKVKVKKNLKTKKVFFKFNGKKLNAKINKKGVAKVTVNKSMLKKLKKGKKVTYQAIYLKDTVKRTVKVQK